MKPEEKAEIKIWDWLKTKGINIIEIYFNRINQINALKFRVEGNSQEKPDFIVSFQGVNEIEFIAIEIKDNKKSMQVQDSQKIINYYKKYFSKETKYFIENKEIKINYFLVATNNSPEGHLFKDELKTGFQDNKEDHESLLKYNLFPRYEFQRTHDFMRSLTARFRDLRKEINIKEESPALGILIANPNPLMVSKIDNIPYMQIIKYLDKRFYGKKSQWSQKFWRL